MPQPSAWFSACSEVSSHEGLTMGGQAGVSGSGQDLLQTRTGLLRDAHPPPCSLAPAALWRLHVL